MFCEFKKFDLGNGLEIIEPPAGLLLEIHKRTKIYTDENDVLSANIWAGIFVLACLHENGEPVVAKIAKSIISLDIVDDNGIQLVTPSMVDSIRGVYTDLPDHAFKSVITEFIYQLSRDKLQEWFDIVDTNYLITKKKTDELKND